VRDGHRLLYDEARVRSLITNMRDELHARMRDELHAQHSRHLAEMAALRAELEQLRGKLDELRAVSLARSRAELEVAELRRLREIGRARAAERDPAQPLH